MEVKNILIFLKKFYNELENNKYHSVEKDNNKNDLDIIKELGD